MTYRTFTSCLVSCTTTSLILDLFKHSLGKSRKEGFRSEGNLTKLFTVTGDLMKKYNFWNTCRACLKALVVSKESGGCFLLIEAVLSLCPWECSETLLCWVSFTAAFRQWNLYYYLHWLYRVKPSSPARMMCVTSQCGFKLVCFKVNR